MESLTIAQFTLADVLRQHARYRGDDVALVCGDTRQIWRELDRRATALAAAMLRDGVRSGDRVLWCGQNCHRLLEALFAAAVLGATLCPVNWRQSADELAFVLEDADPRVVIWQQAEIGETITAARAQARTNARWIQHDGTGFDGYERYLADSPRSVSIDHVDSASPILMLYTAAFDGRPNGALLSHRALLAQTMTIRALEGVSADDVYLNSGPLFHIGSFRRTLAVWHAGGRNVMVRRADAEELCRLIDSERCTGAFLQTPTMLRMIEYNADHRYDLSTLRTAGGPPGWERLVGQLTTPTVRSGYGQTELAGVVTFCFTAEPSIGGKPGPLAHVDVVAPDATPVAAGETGEIVVRGPMVMNGYHNRPRLTAYRQRGGWHHTQDLGRREPDGSISFVAPLVKMIKSAAENIYPVEVEQCLRAHPAVADVAVLGVPDTEWGQRVKAVVVLRDEANITETELVDHCRGALAGYKRPRDFEFVDALPFKHGQLDRDDVDYRYGGGGYPGVS
jgi:acyl-CoA synthetase (AMP-forming)/AMP-acid ligase II